MTKKAANAEQAVQIGGGQILEASLQDTFAVGGVLVDNQSGTTVFALRNNAVEVCHGQIRRVTAFLSSSNIFERRSDGQV